MIDAKDSNSTRPYLIRALYEWCTDSGFTPYIAVSVDRTVQVPVEYVKNGEIVLNISLDATSALSLGNECIEFKGRFGGVARDIYVPVDRVMAIYARENGQGMAFPMLPPPADPVAVVGPQESRSPSLVRVLSVTGDNVADDPPTPRPSGGVRPSLTRVK